ncbi:unnamed protein product [Closterium sp. NIES-54]
MHAGVESRVAIPVRASRVAMPGMMLLLLKPPAALFSPLLPLALLALKFSTPTGSLLLIPLSAPPLPLKCPGPSARFVPALLSARCCSFRSLMALPCLTPFKLPPLLLLPTSALLLSLLCLLLLSPLRSPSPILAAHAMTSATEPEPTTTTPAAEPELTTPVGAAALLHQGWRWLGVGPLMSNLGSRLGTGLGVGRNAEEDGGGENKAREFLAGRPQVEVATCGGRIETWGAGLKRLEDADVSAAVMTIEPQSMALPMYSNDEEVGYAILGYAILSLIAVHDHSDAFTCPQQATSDLHVSVTLDIPGNLLLRCAGDVTQLLQGQKDAAIAKVDPGKVISADPDDDDDSSAASAADNSEGTVAFGDFVYNFIEEQASIETPGGGTLTTADGFKLPVFQHLGVSAARIDLLPNAMAAPHWLSNSAAVHFVTRGSGRFEIAYPDGKKALRKRVSAGDLVVVPAAFAHAVVSNAVMRKHANAYFM